MHNWKELLEQYAEPDGVYLDALSGAAGTAPPLGSPSNPVSNLADAIIIAAALKTPVAYFYDGLGDQDALAAQRDAAQEFMLSTEGMELMAAFPRIAEPAIRRKIVELVRVVADEG